MTHGISGKTIAITGASSGIGAAIARHLARAGSNVVLGVHRAERLDALVDEITQSGGRVIEFPVDVR